MEDICFKRTMFAQRVSGNGGCLFTSLALNYFYLESLTKTELFKQADMNGLTRDRVINGFQLRLSIVNWLQNNLQTEITALGSFNEKEKLFLVRDVLNLELARKEDLPDEIWKQNKRIYAYLSEMCDFDTWGSTPEYIAFSILSGITVHIWRKENEKLILNDSFPNHPPQFDDPASKEIHLLFCYGNHYEPLLKKSLYIELEKSVDGNFLKYFSREIEIT